MANFLMTLLQGLAQSQQDTPVDEITVSPMRPKPAPQMAPLQPRPEVRNPFTPDYLMAAQQAAQSQGQLPRVSGGTDRGLFGFLPEGPRNGRLRDVLGAVGDGILLGAGHKPIYQPRVDNRQMGQAMIGYEQDPYSAIERLGQTGAPGSVDMMEKLIPNLQTVEARKAYQNQTAEYRSDMNRNRSDVVLQKMGNSVPGILNRAKTAEEYAGAWDRLDQMVKRIDPEANPTSAWGIPDPMDWEPGMTDWIGTTGGQQLSSDVQREGIGQRREASTMSSADRRAGIAQRASAAGQSSADRRAAIAQRQAAAELRAKTAGGGKPKLTPKAAPKLTPKTTGGKTALPASAIAAFSKGTPAQKAQAKRAWASQGFDTSKLK